MDLQASNLNRADRPSVCPYVRSSVRPPVRRYPSRPSVRLSVSLSSVACRLVGNSYIWQWRTAGESFSRTKPPLKSHFRVSFEGADPMARGCASKLDKS